VKEANRSKKLEFLLAGKNKTTSDDKSVKTQQTKKTMKKTLLVLLAAAGVSTAAFAQDFNYVKGDVLLGFRLSDPNRTAQGAVAGSSRAYIVNLGQIATVANYTPAWEGINLSGDLVTVFGNDWETTTTWGMLSIPTDRTRWAASSDVANGGASIVSRTVAFLSSYQAELGNIGTAFNSLSTEPGDAVIAGKLTQGVWGTTDDLPWSTAVEANSFGVGAFEAATSSNLDLYIAYGPTYGTTGNALRSTTADVNTFSVQGGTLQSVPEPSTYALFGFAALLLIVAYRRANA
jgi:hypothetical protein